MYIGTDHLHYWMQDQLLVLQSNNYNIEEHVRTAQDLTEFEKQSNIEVFWLGKLELPLYTRYMLIGKKKWKK